MNGMYIAAKQCNWIRYLTAKSIVTNKKLYKNICDTKIWVWLKQLTKRSLNFYTSTSHRATLKLFELQLEVVGCTIYLL